MRARPDIAGPGPAQRVIDLPGPDATDALGAALARALGPGDTLLMTGDLGAGKSHLARAVIRALAGAGTEVPSPTFTLVQTYDAPGPPPFAVVHADLYRLGDPSEAEEIGLGDAIGRDLCLIEWPDRLGWLAPGRAWRIVLEPRGEGRRATLRTPRGAAIR